MTFLYVLLALFSFGILIFIHEGGHFLFARLFRVSINEFSIGMGPAIFKKKSKKSGIQYSLRAIPIGGFVSMVGEDGSDEDADGDPNAFNKKPIWQRFIVLVAGAATNILVGILVMSILVGLAPALGSTTVASVPEGSVAASYGFEVGDVITEIDGRNVHIADQLFYQIMRRGIKPIDITVERDGKEIVLEDVEFSQMTEKGTAFAEPDFKVFAEEKGFSVIAKHSFFRATNTVTMIWESLYDLVTGRYGLDAVSGPVGATAVMTDAAKQSSYSFINLVVIISMNLGVMNLLPFPALDGGRILFLIIEGIRRKPLNPKVEGYVNAAGFALLIMFSIFICVKDVIGLF